MTPLIPTIFAHNKEEFKERYIRLVSISRNLQIDFMDGKFVKSKSVSLQEIPDLKKCKNKFEAHLMVNSPENWISQLKEKGFEKIIVHVESTKKLEEIIKTSKAENLILYLAINPETPTEKAFPYLSRIKGVLFMGVNPGKEHQKLLPEIYSKIKLLKSVNKAVKIQVDGGVNEKNVSRLAKAGVNYVNSGSHISDAINPKEEYRLLTKLFKEAK